MTGSSFARKAGNSARSTLWERTAEKKDLKCVDQAEPGSKKDEKRQKERSCVNKERKKTDDDGGDDDDDNDDSGGGGGDFRKSKLCLSTR